MIERRNCSLDELYSRVSEITKQVLYPYMKEEEISTLNYHFHYYFNYCVHENNIQVISHHFSNHKIEGLTVIDELGTSFSYEHDNPVTKRNFTLCHELGHFILKHEGSYFTESVDNQESILEREANVFSAIVLMPDIVLLSKIYYSCDSFQKVKEDLEVSKQALYFRLLDLLREFFPNKEDRIKKAIGNYIVGQNVALVHLFSEIKKQLIEEFNQYKPCLKKQIENYVNREGFASSTDFPELLDQNKWKDLKEGIQNLKIWLIYNKGRSVAYAWDRTKLSDKDARRKAEFQMSLM